MQEQAGRFSPNRSAGDEVTKLCSSLQKGANPFTSAATRPERFDRFGWNGQPGRRAAAHQTPEPERCVACAPGAVGRPPPIYPVFLARAVAIFLITALMLAAAETKVHPTERLRDVHAAKSS